MAAGLIQTQSVVAVDGLKPPIVIAPAGFSVATAVGVPLAGVLGSLPSLTALPTANRQLPQWTTYAGLGIAASAAGASYTDPTTGVKIWKLTSSTVPAANGNMAHAYASGGLHISGPWGASSDHYTMYVLNSTVANGYLLDFSRTGGPTNYRAAPWDHDLRYTFSYNPATPQIAYYINTSGHVVRYDTGLMAEAPNATFPSGGKDLSATIGTGAFEHFQTGVDERWFIVLNAAGNTVFAWDSQQDTILSCSTTRIGAVRSMGLDEPHFEKDGRYVFIKGGSYVTANLFNQMVWDLQNDKLSDVVAGWSHDDCLRSIATGFDPQPSSGPQTYFIPVPVTVEKQNIGSQTIWATDSQFSSQDSHRSGQWTDQPGSGTGQYVLYSSECPEGARTPGSWSLDSGSVYKGTVGYQYEQSVTGIQDVLQLDSTGTTIAARLTMAASRVAMTAGTAFISGTTLYVWRTDNAAPDSSTHKVVAMIPGKIHDGIGFAKLDGTDNRLLAHHYSFNPPADYWTQSHATIARDGRLAMFTSNMGTSGGRHDVFLIEVPLGS